MSPNGSGQKQTAQNSLYTVMLATALAAVVVTAIMVAFKCLTQYGTFFNIP